MVMPFSTIPHFYGYWFYGPQGCLYYGFCGMFCGLAIIGIITLFGIDRYLVICKPHIGECCRIVSWIVEHCNEVADNVHKHSSELPGLIYIAFTGIIGVNNNG